MAEIDKHIPFMMALIAKKKRPLEDHESMGQDEDAPDEDHEKALSAMEDLIDSIHAKDAEKALDAYGDLCELYHGDEDSEDESDQGESSEKE